MNTPDETHESRQSLWLLVVPAGIWAGHFMLCYLTAAVWCAKFGGRDGSLGPVRWAIGIYTLVGLTGIVISGWVGYRRHRFREGSVPHDFDSPEDRHRFLGFATFLLSALGAVAMLYAASVAIFFWDCH